MKLFPLLYIVTLLFAQADDITLSSASTPHDIVAYLDQSDRAHTLDQLKNAVVGISHKNLIAAYLLLPSNTAATDFASYHNQRTALLNLIESVLTPDDIPDLLAAPAHDPNPNKHASAWCLEAIRVRKFQDDPRVVVFLVNSLQQYQQTYIPYDDERVKFVFNLVDQSNSPEVATANVNLHKAFPNLRNLPRLRAPLVKASGVDNTIESLPGAQEGVNQINGVINKTVPTGSLLCLAYSPDGKTFASGGTDNSIKLWDTTTHRCNATWSRHQAAVTSMSWSPDGKTLASASFDHTVKLWNAATGQCIATLTGHTDFVWAVRWSPDGKTVASGSSDQTIKIWNVATGECTATLGGHTGSVVSLAFSPDGKTLASGGSDATIKLWDMASGACTATLTGHSGEISSLDFTPDSKVLASGSRDNTIKLWVIPTDDRVETASSSSSYSLKLWSIPAALCLGTLSLHDGPVLCVRFSPDGQILASGGKDATVHLWSVSNDHPKTTLTGSTGAVAAIAWAPDGKSVVTGGKEDVARIWDVTTVLNPPLIADAAANPIAITETNPTPAPLPALNRVTALTGLPSGVTSLSWNSDNVTLACGCDDGSVALCDSVTGESKATLAGHAEKVASVSFSPDGKALASGSADNSLKLWSVATGQCTSTLAEDTAVRCVAWSPDGKTVAAGSRILHLWDTATGKVTATLSGFTDSTACASWSPDGRTLAAGSRDGSLKLWDSATAENKMTLSGHQAAVTSIGWSPDGTTLATASDDKTIKLWNALTGLCLATLTGSSGPVASVAFSPYGKTVASTGAGGALKLWDIATGKCLREINQGIDGNCLGWSPDGKTLAVASGANTVLLQEVAAMPEPVVAPSIAVPAVTESVSKRTIELDDPWSNWTSNTLRWTPDGQILVDPADDGSVRFWNGRSRELLQTISSTKWRGIVSWSPQANLVASGNYNDSIDLWDVATGKLTRKLTGHEQPVVCLRFSLDGKTLASADKGGVIKIWDVASGACTASFTDTEPNRLALVRAIYWTSNGKTLTTVAGTTVRLWDVAGGTCRATITVASPNWSPDGGTLADIDQQTTIKLWNLATGQSMTSLASQDGKIDSVRWSPDEKMLAVVCTGNRGPLVEIWDAASGTCRTTFTNIFNHSGARDGVCWSPDGKTLACADSAGTKINLWDVNSNVCRTGSWLHASLVNVTLECMAWSPDGKTLAATLGAFNVRTSTVTIGYCEVAAAKVMSVDRPRSR